MTFWLNLYNWVWLNITNNILANTLYLKGFEILWSFDSTPLKMNNKFHIFPSIDNIVETSHLLMINFLPQIYIRNWDCILSLMRQLTLFLIYPIWIWTHILIDSAQIFQCLDNKFTNSHLYSDLIFHFHLPFIYL